MANRRTYAYKKRQEQIELGDIHHCADCKALFENQGSVDSDPQDITRCDECSHDICDNCSFVCRDCGTVLCGSHIWQCDLCSSGHYYYCHHCLETCKACHQAVCSSCWDRDDEMYIECITEREQKIKKFKRARIIGPPNNSVGSNCFM